jgi:hypothetical protein
VADNLQQFVLLLETRYSDLSFTQRSTTIRKKLSPIYYHYVDSEYTTSIKPVCRPEMARDSWQSMAVANYTTTTMLRPTNAAGNNATDMIQMA